MRAQWIAAIVIAAVRIAHADTAANVETAAAPASVTVVLRPPPTGGIAFGVELGSPTSATAGWFKGKLGLTGAIGTGTLGGVGLSLHAEARYDLRKVDRFQLRAGGGLRYYHHGYDPVSIDEIPDSHYGLRAIVELGMDRGPLQLYAELAPGLDFKRTNSCSLVEGVDSICPHSQKAPWFVNIVVGARWFALR